jgi:hypothetical protein
MVSTKVKKKTVTTLKEVASCYYNEKQMVRRVLYDQHNYNRQLICQLKPNNMLQIRADIIKRGLLLNEYTYANSHLKERALQSEYFDKNIGNLSYSIVENYRRELNFSWVSWQLVDQIR